MGEGARTAALERRVEELEQRVEALERALVGPALWPVQWGLTGSEARVLGCLAQRDLATKDQIMAALYEDRIYGGPEPKIVDVFVCKLRRKMKPFGVAIANRHGVGYALAGRARLREIAGRAA